MKKIFLKNLSSIVIASFIISISFFMVAAYSRADDDRGDNEDNFRQSNEDNFQQPTAPQPVEVIQSQPIITQTPAIVPSVSPPVSDNSAILAALNDSDKDGIPDIIDKYPGQDDFAYYLLDRNKNGIADDLEKLIK